MIQIYNKQNQSYETWGNKRSPITSNTASSGGVEGLTLLLAASKRQFQSPSCD